MHLQKSKNCKKKHVLISYNDLCQKKKNLKSVIKILHSCTSDKKRPLTVNSNIKLSTLKDTVIYSEVYKKKQHLYTE